MKKYAKPLTSGEIAAVRDKHIDYSDIPELDDAFWRDAELVEPDTTEQVTMRIKRSVLDFFKESGKKGYQTRMNRVLETYVQRQRKLESSGGMTPIEPQRGRTS